MSRTSGTPRTQSLARAVGLLRALAERPGGSSASELARETGLPRSTVTRTLHTLADFGLTREGAGGWVLGDELVRLARSADPHGRLVETAYAAVAKLRDTTGESASLAAPRPPADMEILLQLDPERHVGVANWVGVDVPLHASSAGKVVLAELEPHVLEARLGPPPLQAFTERTLTDVDSLERELARIRRQGWAEIDGELEEGLAAISAPVRAADGTLTAIVGVSGPSFRLTRARRRETLAAVLAAAAEIESRLRPSA